MKELKELRLKRRRRAMLWVGLWVVLGFAAALYFFDPFTDLIQKGRRAAFGPPDGGRPALAAPAQVVLFFPSAGADLLARHPAEVEQGKEPIHTVRNALEALLKGPQRPGYAPAAPPGAKLRTAVPGPDGTLLVDFDKSFRASHPGGAWSEYLTAYAVANTVLHNFKDFQRVRILIEGQETETVAGALSLNEPLRLREDLVMREDEAAAPVQPGAVPPAPAPAGAAPPAQSPPRENPAQAPAKP